MDIIKKNKNMKAQELPDWQRGNESKTSPLERLELMKEWLMNNKLDVLTKSKPIVEKPVVGFIDVDIYE